MNYLLIIKSVLILSLFCFAESSFAKDVKYGGNTKGYGFKNTSRDTCWRTNRATGQKFRIC